MPNGEVVFINPPEKHGKIKRTDDGSNSEYQYQIPQDLADQAAAQPVVGSQVTFEVDPAQAQVARSVAVADDGGGDKGR